MLLLSLATVAALHRCLAPVITGVAGAEETSPRLLDMLSGMQHGACTGASTWHHRCIRCHLICWHQCCRILRCKITGASDAYRLDRCIVTGSSGATVCCILCPTRRCGHLDISKYILSLLFHCDFIFLRWVGHLVSTVYWTSLLNVALDISSRRCIGRLGDGLDIIHGN